MPRTGDIPREGSKGPARGLPATRARARAMWEAHLVTGDPHDLVRLAGLPSAAQAQLARSLLESRGIPVVLKGEVEGPYRMGPAYLWVAKEHEADARRLLDEAESGALELEADE